MEIPHAAVSPQAAAVFAATRRIASPGASARRSLLVKRIRSLRSRFVAVSAASRNGGGNRNSGDVGSSDDILRKVEKDLEMLAEAEAAAEAALKKLEKDKRSLFDESVTSDLGLEDLSAENATIRSKSGSTSSKLSDPLPPFDKGDTSKPSLSADRLSSALESASADLRSSAGLEFSLEEIEEQLQAKVGDPVCLVCVSPRCL